MKHINPYNALLLALVALLLGPISSFAQLTPSCPGDTDGDAIIDIPDPAHPNAVCMHLSSGDGYVTMADGRVQYIFGYQDVTGVSDRMVMSAGLLGATFPAPTIVVDQGDELFLSLTNVGMFMRPDLFDSHTVHYHGFPNAAPVFDGVPDSSMGIGMGATMTYYYKNARPGTYAYHCHVEAAEHMQMGMLGNLYVRPAQDGTPLTFNGRTYSKFAYNDGDGSTGYDVDFPVQIGSFDPAFHDADETVQPLPFAMMKDKYPMLNGRGYPDTVNPLPLPAPAENGGKTSQWLDTLIEATAGERILLRISNLNITRFYTLASLGIPMQVVGKDARLLRGPTGKELYYTTNSVTVGGGETFDVILDTQGVAPGTYFLYAANLNYLSNNQEDFGGMMTEIVIH